VNLFNLNSLDFSLFSFCSHTRRQVFTSKKSENLSDQKNNAITLKMGLLSLKE
jgi:hypothetical protein